MHTKLRSMPIVNICLLRPQCPFSEQDKNDVSQFIKRLVGHIQYSTIQRKLPKCPKGIIELIIDINSGPPSVKTFQDVNTCSRKVL